MDEDESRSVLTARRRGGKTRVLVVEDEQDIADLVKHALEPIIIVTARGSEADRVIGLDTGADDYITKPFSLRELAARVRAVLRRRRGEAFAPQIYRSEHLLADFDAVSVRVDGRPVRLTRREFELLQYLVENRNRVLSRDRLLERVWGC